MSPERWQRIEDIFDAAVLLPSEERERFLDEHCVEDLALRRELADLLRHSDHGTTFKSVVGLAFHAAAQARNIGEGRRLGVYRVLRAIGSGGMGAVFLAVRDDDEYYKEVAIKVLRFETFDSQTLTRFRQERQVLATLEHPNISRLLDGGTSEDGMPYIVMDYIAGVPITDYRREKDLDIKNSLNLFRQVCDGVQYAHQRLVVHRDIKPANILVTEEGTPKLLDFGIAKLLDTQSDPDASAYTMTAIQAMTPAYASPEQVRGEPVSTATDVYSLGAVLFEMLTGTRAQVLKTTDPAELKRVICDDGVGLPSRTGGRRLRGDLDNIVLKAMHKEPGRRYQSAGQFSEDLQRYLDGLPVLAQPDSLVYRAKKYVGRHWLGVASAAAVVLALSVGLGIAVREARIARQRFGEVRELANRFLFQVHDAIAPLNGSTKPRELIVATALEYLGRLEKDARNDPALGRELAAAYVKVGRVQGFPAEPNLGRIADARKSLQKAVEIYSRYQPITPAQVEEAVEPMNRLAYLEFDQGRQDDALMWARRAISLAEKVPLKEMTPPLATAYASLHFRIMGPLEEKGDSEAAYQEARVAERVMNEYAPFDRTGKFDRRPLMLLGNLETAARLSGRLEEALAIAEERLKKAGGTAEARTLYCARVSEIYASIDEPSWDETSKALVLVREMARNQERRLRLDPNDINTKYDVAVNYSKIGYYLRESDPEEAVRALEYTIGMFESLVQQDPHNREYPSRLARYRARMSLARSYLHQKRQVEALTEEVLALKDMPAQARLHVLNLCGQALSNVGSKNQARQTMEQATRLGSDLLAEQPNRMSLRIEVTRAFEQQAEFLRSAGDVEAAVGLLSRAREIWQNYEPATTYVQIRRAKAEKLLAGITGAKPAF